MDSRFPSSFGFKQWSNVTTFREVLLPGDESVALVPAAPGLKPCGERTGLEGEAIGLSTSGDAIVSTQFNWKYLVQLVRNL